MPTVELPYTPRWYQEEFEQALFNGKRRACLLWHRRMGKDLACWNFTVNCAVQGTPGTYHYGLPSYKQAKKVIWKGIDEGGQRIIKSIPSCLIKSTNESEMSIELFNGSIIQCVGTDDFDSLRGVHVRGIVLSEYAKHRPGALQEVYGPILRKNPDTWLVVNSTPLGKNHFYDLWSAATHSDEWFTSRYTVDDTGLVTQEQLGRERELVDEEIIQQEYYVSFDRGIEGSFYGRHLQTSESEGRITSVPHDPSIGVYTAWDLGWSDFTSIIFFQLVPGGEIHIIDFYETSRTDIPEICRELKQRPYNYETFVLPHDARAKRLEARGLSIEAQVEDQGFRDIWICEAHHEGDGIKNVKSLFSRFWFDDEKTYKLRHHLDNYCKVWSERENCYTDRAKHDHHSHAADSLRYLAAFLKLGKAAGNAAIEWSAIKQDIGYHSQLEQRSNGPPEIIGW